MHSLKRYGMRGIRKSTFLTNKVLSKTLKFSLRVENKATRILDGTDFGVRLNETIPLEKIYYNNLNYITPLNPALPKVGQRPSVVLLLPSLQSGSFYGGTATALFVAARLAEKKSRPLRIVQTLVTGHARELSSFLAKEGIQVSPKDITVTSVADRAYNIYGYMPMHPDDIFIASAWWDAYLLNQLPLNKKFIYLVQDFEPIFYNNGDSYVLAESTYKMDSFIPLCNTRLMYDFMRDRRYPAFDEESASYFEPAVSRIKTGVTSKDAEEKRRLFLYGRPSVHRNLFFTALNAVDYCFKADLLDRSHWELFTAGQDNLPDIKLGSGMVIKNLGKMPMEEYVRFSKTVDVAVSPMMAPHPNYPTLEFASIGAAVVTTRYANKHQLDNYSKNIVMSDIGVESLAGAIKVAADISHKDREKNLTENNIPHSWADSLDDVLERIDGYLTKAKD
jgi:hypothetical protein